MAWEGSQEQSNQGFSQEMVKVGTFQLDVRAPLGAAGERRGPREGKPPMPLVGRLVLVVFVVSFVGADPRTGGLETQ